MRPCFLRIVTSSRETRSVFEAKALAAWTGESCAVRYFTEDDLSELLIEADRLTMSRRGSVGLAAVFQEGTHGEMTAGLGESGGGIPLFTASYRPTFSENGIVVLLSYSLFGEQFSADYSLEISIIPEES